MKSILEQVKNNVYIIGTTTANFGKHDVMIQLMNQAIKHDLTDISKVLGINVSAIGISIWGNLIPALQAVALLIGIGYTAWKWYRDFRKHKENE